MTTVINAKLYQVHQSRFPTDPEAPCPILPDGRGGELWPGCNAVVKVQKNVLLREQFS